jgi:hypothetical protein
MPGNIEQDNLSRKSVKSSEKNSDRESRESKP